MEASRSNTDLLNRAFLDFSQASEVLKNFYQRLESRIHELNLELEEKNRELEESLRENETMKDYLSNILESIASGVVVLDDKGNISTFNGAMQRITSLSWETLRGEDFYSILGSKLGMPAKDVDAILGAEFIANFETRIKPGAKTTSVSLTVSPLRNYQNHIMGTVVVLQDITKMKRLEAQAQRTGRLVAMGEMAIKMAHEIRNPLGSIEIFASILRKELLSDSRNGRIAHHICSGVKSLNHIVSNYLFFSRSPKPCFKEIDLHKCLDESLDFVAFLVKRQDIKLVKRYGARYSFIPGDNELLKQVTFNIVLNAVQAMSREGNIIIETNNYVNENQLKVQNNDDVKLDTGLIEIKFIDSGQGINDADLDSIFNPFFTTKENGAGLGLAIVHSIVEAHGGSIECESVNGLGTTFSIMLPLAAEE